MNKSIMEPSMIDEPCDIIPHSALGFVNLGCPNAVLDCQALVNQLLTAGYDIVDERSSVPAIIVYCCGDLDSYVSDLQSLCTHLPDDGQLIVTGNYTLSTAIQTTLPKVACVPTHQLVSHVKASFPVECGYTVENTDLSQSDELLTDKVRLTPSHYAYLPLSEPAFHLCSVVAAADKKDSVPANAYSADDIFAYAQQLVQSGVQELLLVAPHAMSDEEIIQLCQRLITLNVWLRLHDVFSPTVVQRLIPFMKQGDILPSLILSCTDAEAGALPVEQLAQWKASAPALVINIRVTVGQKQQTNESLTVLLDTLTALDCYEVIAVPYQRLPHVGRDSEEILSTIQQINHQQTIRVEQRQQERIGGIEPVMIDDVIEDEEINNIALGRSVYDAPGIGGIVQIEDIYGAQAGQIVHVEIIDTVDKNMIAIPA